MAPEYDKEPCIYCFLLNETFIIAVVEAGSYDVAQTGHLFSQPSKRWHYRYNPPHLAEIFQKDVFVFVFLINIFYIHYV